jgi:hypothetical protein
MVPPPAGAAVPATASTNWAGYAVNGGNRGFRRAVSTWRVPTGTCQSGRATYSAAWVGLGGYRDSSRSLEQIGTEFDCRASGRPRYSAWYELVPAVSRNLSMRVRAGDLIAASVQVRGRRVTLTLRNRTSGARFRKVARMSSPDLTSAEWIVEAPSACNSAGRCRELPLSAFADIPFGSATATDGAGHTGTISDPAWSVTRLNLTQAGQGGRSGPVSGAGASPSDLFSGGTAFTVTYQSQSGSQGRRARSLPGLAR